MLDRHDAALATLKEAAAGLLKLLSPPGIVMHQADAFRIAMPVG